jgi:hypothetical protein
MFELFAKPLTQTLDDIDGAPLSTLLVGGIVNPFGPTLNAIAAVGEFVAGRTLPLVQLSLNPFNQDVHQIGRAVVTERWHPREAYGPLLAVPAGACPTLLLASNLLEEDEAIEVAAAWFGHFADAAQVRKSIAHFPGDPWKRVQQDIDSAFDGANKTKPASGCQPLDDQQRQQLARTLLSPGHFRPELQAFLHAWEGSISFVRDQGGGRNALGAMGAESFHEWLAAILASCHIPSES